VSLKITVCDAVQAGYNIVFSNFVKEAGSSEVMVMNFMALYFQKVVIFTVIVYKNHKPRDCTRFFM
jgi:hypothetical protein